MKIVTVVGARPQFIKAGVVSRALRMAGITETLIHTGQHYDENMSEVFFDELEIARPEYNLGVGSGLHGEQTGKMLQGIEKVLLERQPEWVLVYGDTNSTLAGALAAVKLHIRVAHVEAGLRSNNRKMPEEINRILTDHSSDILFSPTKTATSNLIREGISEHNIRQTGDVMYDAAIYYAQKASSESRILCTLSLKDKPYALATVHRAENTDDPLRLKAIIDALKNLSAELPVIWPVHPRTKRVINDDSSATNDNLFMIEPVGYLDMVNLEQHANLIITDSGGVQKEAFFYGVPCVTLRDETEWVELVETRWNRLAPPTSAGSITGVIRSALLAPKGIVCHPYGDGTSSEQICSILLNYEAASP